MLWLDIKSINGQITRPQDVYSWMRNAPQRITAGSQKRHLLIYAPGTYRFQINHFTEAYSLGELVKVDYQDEKKKKRTRKRSHGIFQGPNSVPQPPKDKIFKK